MNKTRQQLIPFSGQHPGRRRLTVAAATVLTAACVVALGAAEAPNHKIVRSYGGISPKPVLTKTTQNADKSVKVEWQGFGGPYQVLKCPALKGTNTTWTALASVTNATTYTMLPDDQIGFVGVEGPDPKFAGAERCGFCHDDVHPGWAETRHANALETLKNIHMDKNPSCLPCHTVGYGLSTGFIDEATTPQFAGVQCENCHGPAGDHASKPNKSVPIKTLSAEMCGGCHTDAHHPTYDEWATSGHGSLEIPEEEFADPTNGPPRMLTCGACHSGASRLALLKEAVNNPDPTKFKPDMPSTEEAASTAITCAVCHDAHEQTGHPSQLRFPLHSEIPYSYSTATNFTANYNPAVQTCAQCHNMRGASWTGTSRPPHHSPQYNILIGKGGFDAGETNAPQSAHMHIENQCAQCHTHPHAPDEITEATPSYTGHNFLPTMQACAPCHDEVGGAVITEAVQLNTKQQIAEVKALLDEWGLTKAPEALRTKYGAYSWEFTNLGQLSPPSSTVKSGPTSAEQATIPNNIKQARYNLYLVEHDGSYGVHNGNYSRFILKVARDKVKAEL